jgi:hypothetical protein
MVENRIKISNIIKNQIPSYIREEFPLFGEFLSQYYVSQEYQGSPLDLIQNIDQYVKIDQLYGAKDSIFLLSNISFFDETIIIDIRKSPTGTNGFPNKYGILKINDEIITYTGKTFNSFTGCIRGFSGIDSYRDNNAEELIFSNTNSSEHQSGSVIFNLSALFLNEFLLKTKKQLTPGFEGRNLSEGLNESLIIKQIRNFYTSKGTDRSFEILFKILYGENVKIIKPRDYLFRPSDANYQVISDIIVESIEGNVEELYNSTLFQKNQYDYTKAYAPISKVEKILAKDGKIYYKLSFDSNYNRDIINGGSLYGNFKIHHQTKVIGNYDQNSTTIDVDSTLGFPENGDLYVIYKDGTAGVISYNSKNINQFFECSNIRGIVEDKSSIFVNAFASNEDDSIKVRITSVLSDVDIIGDTYYLKSGYESHIKTLGIETGDFISNNWLFNISPQYLVNSISLIDDSDKTYRITTNANHIFSVGDSLKIKGRDNVEKNSFVVDILSNKSFIINSQGDLSLSDEYIIQRNISKVNSSSFPESSIFNANVQNIYKDNEKILVSSTSLPYYGKKSLNLSNREIVFSGTFNSDTFKITTNTDHGFYTGDAVYYTPEKQIIESIDEDENIFRQTTVLSSLFKEGIYYIKRIDSNTIKFSLSKNDIFNSRFVSVKNEVNVSSNKIQYYDFNNKKLKSQNILREISLPINDGKIHNTESGFTGILINGVEILNYKSKDVVYYGKLDEIEVISAGKDYDIINPPILSIQDSVGLGASGHCSIKGSLNEIRIIDSGFDYLEVPSIRITGGNGIGAKAQADIKYVTHQSIFNSEITSSQISLSNNTIGFSTYHKFRDTERVIYITDKQRGVGGLSSESQYYVSVQSPIEIKLHKTKNDAIVGINTIQFTSYGIGNHFIRSFDKKIILGSISIENSGFGYENKKRTVSSSVSGINTSINQINILNHDFKTGEIVKYSTTGIEIGGLSNNTEYYLTAVDNNNFKLSNVGTESDSKDFFYKAKQFINFTSIGSGIHNFNYPEISVEVIGDVGGSIPFKAQVQPIFRGEITSVHLQNSGLGYGSSEILNYIRQPSIKLLSGSGAQVTPIISNGKIIQVLINSTGNGYTSTPDLIIDGLGTGSVLVPIISDGKLIDVKVVESGIGYSNDTKIRVTSPGSFAEFFAKIQRWNVNLFQKLLPIITEDDGFLTEGINKNYELQFSHLYAPRNLREIIYSRDQDGNVLYGKSDLRRLSGKEINSTDHSPIIGWAYDGNPIYGPYGYSTKKGGIVAQMKSGYKEDLKPNRPSKTIFPVGFFIEDYTHFKVSDETFLDENNGRFCITPEYPNGIYAYFATISDGLPDSFSSKPFSGNKRPVFPYFIGNTFKSKPNDFNFEKSSNQNNINLNETKWSRNITPYNLIENKLLYNYINIPNLLDQKLEIKYASPGSIDDIEIISGGFNYKVGDQILFDNEGTGGLNAFAEVERISGKPINSISADSTTLYNLEFYPNTNQGKYLLFSESPHNLTNLDIITVSGLNTTSSLLEGSYSSEITSNLIILSSEIENTSVTGIVTYFSVLGNLTFPNLRENDILSIGIEQVKVLNIDKISSRIRVLREVNGTVGSSHSIGQILYEIPRKISISTRINTQSISKLNREIYFNPEESIGIGTTSGVGIGNTIVFSNPGVGITQIFIPTQSIYIPDHKLETGDELIYYSNSGDPIGVSTDGISTSVSINNETKLYVAKLNDDLIGISTFKVVLSEDNNFIGLSSDTNNYGIFYFTDFGSGEYHSFKTNYNSIIGNISKNNVTIVTSESHNLLNGDSVFVDINPSIATTFIVKYNDYNKKLLINPKHFSSLDVNVDRNIITIIDHGFKTGQKVIHTSSSPSVGIVDNLEYYIFVIDTDNIKLTDSYFESLNLNPTFVNISSASFGTLSSINPLINGFRNSSIVFDLTDTSLSFTQQSNSYPAFEFSLFKDANFTEPYEGNSLLEIKKEGIVGVSSNAKLILNINNLTPKNIYYNLIPIYNGNLPDNKRLINFDSEVISNNELKIQSSLYNGQYDIIVGTSTSFTYTIPTKPEREFYSQKESLLRYETDSKNSNGPISKIKIKSQGKNYHSLPSIIGVKSGVGSGSILEPSSRSIGKIKTTRIKDIGFNFPSDFTIRPSIAIPQIIKVDPLSSIESIEIIYFGRGYISAPKLLVLDGKTKKVSPEVDLKITLDSNKVEILANAFDLNNVTPTILPIQNSNGVGISSIYYESFTGEVTVDLSVGFSTANSFPFAVNDRVLIENINILDNSGKGFNSENYSYQLFTVTSINENIGGFGSVSYSLDGFLKNSEIPGIFDSDNSSGRIIPEKYFPTFDVRLKKNSYLIGEEGISDSAQGKVEDWDTKSNFVKIISKNKFKEGEIVIGSLSRTRGIIKKVDSFDAFFNLSSSSRFENGWQSAVGFLNDNIQRIQDSLYYQNFSYSLKSKVDFNTWNDVVSTLNHTSGFKKFSDYQLESNLSAETSNALIVNLPSDLTSIDIITDIVGVVNLNCVYDFDLVRENALNIGGRILSDEIIFSNRVLTDYAKSVGNRVLSIDDISSQFNSNPRPTRFSEVHRFNLSDVRSQKYIIFIRDVRFAGERQFLIVTSLIDDFGRTYLNQYARVESNYDMGSFELTIDGSEGVLLFYPTKTSINDFGVTTLSYNINDDLLGIGNTNFGGVVDIQSGSILVPSEPTTIVGIASTYRAAKVLVSITGNGGRYEFDELTLIHDGTNVELLEYGQLTTHSADSFSSSGLGTYYPYISGSQVNVDFIPNVGVAATINTIKVLFGADSVVGVGTYDMKHARLEGRSTNILASLNPSPTIVYESSDIFDSAYAVIQVSDNTNNIHQISEVALVNDEISNYITEYAILTTLSGIGTIGVQKQSGVNAITFTPLPNIDVNVKVYSNTLRYQDDNKDIISFLNSEIQTDFGRYDGTNRDIRREFNLTHKNEPIFERYFEGDNSFIVDIINDSVIIPNHFFVSGELVKYDSGIVSSENSIGIATTSFIGIGLTDKLPENLYIVKPDENTIKFARSAEDALNNIPKTLDITNVGIGSLHRIVSTNQNAKVVLAIDNLIQSPIVSSAITSTLAIDAFTTDDILYFSSITSFFGGDLIRIEDEIMRIEGVGIGSTNAVQVRRPWLGTVLAGYSSETPITKISGNYNIVDNVLNFAEAPYGNIPLSTTTNPPDEVDWVGISTGSTFQGRSFMRSGNIDSIEETYSKNYVFSDISSKFDGISKDFTLKSNGDDVSGIENENAIILVNDIFQGPGLTYNYNLSESTGITTITFTGAAASVSYDVNNASIPRGGIIVSVGSTEGFGYQPLVSAGGTALVSIAGTISAISIGNSGSGYREGIQVVNVGVGTSSTGAPNIELIGTATVSGGHIVSVAITNPGIGYTFTNPPYVVFDDPLSYSNIPLIYSSGSSGVGVEAKVDIVVGQGSSVIDFEITNTGYGYIEDQILTIPIGGSVGIPTTGISFNEFQISIQKTFADKFSGWSIGELQVLDRLDNKFDGKRRSFSLTIADNLISILSSKGSNINVQDTLLVFINNILQVPGEGYIFSGGSIIRFTEPPKVGDTSKILFYRGSGSIDVVDVDVLETVKIGDELTIGYDPSIGQSPTLQEEPRRVTSINSIDLVNTNPYFGPGNTEDENLERPVKWCRQTEDKIINEKEVAKNRILYNAIINPTSYLIQPVGVGSTIVYVDNIRPFFNQVNENNTSLAFQNKVTFIPQESKVGASATAIISVNGTIASIEIVDGGAGYDSIPSVIIQNSVGIGTTIPVNATASALISDGIVTSINIVNPGIGYTFTNPPIVLIESPSFETEINDVNNYEGDSGIIVGFGTTTIGSNNKIILDLFIPEDSYLRQQSLTGTAVTISSLNAGDYFIVYNSNVGFASTSVTSFGINGVPIGIGTEFIDNVYQVESSEIIEREIVGIGTTYLNRIFINIPTFNFDSFSSTLITFDSTVYTFDNSGISGITTYPGDILLSNNFGNFSWGKISLSFRSKENSYDFYGTNGIGGISTSTIVKRTSPLRFSNYITT